MRATPAPDRPGAAGGAGGAASVPAGGRRTPGWLWTALAALLLLHHDFWFWSEPRLALGLPAGLLYHVIYCLAVAAVMAVAVRRAWPPPGIAASDLTGSTRSARG